jgi:hypothetical protein
MDKIQLAQELATDMADLRLQLILWVRGMEEFRLATHANAYMAGQLLRAFQRSTDVDLDSAMHTLAQALPLLHALADGYALGPKPEWQERLSED